ncbi:MAG: SGNH/GDSL hydrolase family protein, partial [Planctomycetaceae bacterium]
MIRRICCLALMLAACVGMSTCVRGDEPAALPKVVLIGDSIRLSYAPTVIRELDGKAIISQPKANGQDSANVLRHLDEWAVKEQPAIVHFNCGIHDTKKDKTTGAFQVPPEQYEANLRKIVATLREKTQAQVIFATTTPIVDDRAARLRADREYELLDASTQEYNRIAVKVMQELEVPVDDLRAVCGDADEQRRLINADGVHFNAEGQSRLGHAVATCILEHLP